MNTPLIQKINHAVQRKFKEKETEGAIIHNWTLRLRAMQLKIEMNPQNTKDFKVSDSWENHFKKQLNIIDKAITHTIGRIRRQICLECDDFTAKILNLIITENFPDTPLQC